MVLVSGYLIRQVADSGGGDTPTPADIVGRLKRARQLGDPLEYLKTCFVKVGLSYVDILQIRGTTYQVRDNNDEPEVLLDGSVLYGSLKSHSIKCCLYFTDNGGYTGGLRAYAFLNNASICSFVPDETGYAPGQIPAENKEIDGIYYYKVAFMWSIPIFSNVSYANSYAGLVDTYWTSGLDTDLDAIEEYLRQHMITPE